MREDCTQSDLVIDGVNVSTWYSEGADPDWLAMDMDRAREVSGEDSNSMAEITAGWASLLDQTGCNGFGHTELEAINDLFTNRAEKDADYSFELTPAQHKQMDELLDDVRNPKGTN